MLKCEELKAEGSCLNKADDMEIIFVLLARDPAFPATLRFWTEERVRLGKNAHGDGQIKEALYYAKCVEKLHYEPE